MKKRDLKHFSLNKRTISNLEELHLAKGKGVNDPSGGLIFSKDIKFCTITYIGLTCGQTCKATCKETCGIFCI